MFLCGSLRPGGISSPHSIAGRTLHQTCRKDIFQGKTCGARDGEGISRVEWAQLRLGNDFPGRNGRNSGCKKNFRVGMGTTQAGEGIFGSEWAQLGLEKEFPGRIGHNSARKKIFRPFAVAIFSEMTRLALGLLSMRGEGFGFRLALPCGQVSGGPFPGGLAWRRLAAPSQLASGSLPFRLRLCA